MNFVANFIRFPAVQNFENRLRFDKVTESSKVGTFFETQCICTVRWEWLYYNFAARSFHTKKLCSRLYSVEIKFYFFKSLFEPLFGQFRGNVRTPSIPRWKVRGRLPIRQNETFFAICYG